MNPAIASIHQVASMPTMTIGSSHTLAAQCLGTQLTCITISAATPIGGQHGTETVGVRGTLDGPRVRAVHVATWGHWAGVHAPSTMA